MPDRVGHIERMVRIASAHGTGAPSLWRAGAVRPVEGRRAPQNLIDCSRGSSRTKYMECRVSPGILSNVNTLR